MSADLLLRNAVRRPRGGDDAARQRLSRDRRAEPRPDPDDRHDWMALGACRGLDPAMFWPARGDNDSVRRAKAVCAACPVRSDCLAYALEHCEKFGIWGGLSERQRKRLRTHAR